MERWLLRKDFGDLARLEKTGGRKEEKDHRKTKKQGRNHDEENG